jgi:hypothetical protein
MTEKTHSEILFERFLTENRIRFFAIPIGIGKTPDYSVTIANFEVIFEVKEIGGCNSWTNGLHSRIVGEDIRKTINKAKSQLQSESARGKPTVLLIYNNYDPAQLFGTEDHDFEHAMYGEYTLRINRDTRTIIDRFHGRHASFQSKKNTSISALGRLKEQGREASLILTLYGNIHASVPLDYSCFPPCFEVTRFTQGA